MCLSELWVRSLSLRMKMGSTSPFSNDFLALMMRAGAAATEEQIFIAQSLIEDSLPVHLSVGARRVVGFGIPGKGFLFGHPAKTPNGSFFVRFCQFCKSFCLEHGIATREVTL